MPEAKPKTNFCEKCGARLQEDAVFCVKCGLSFNKKKSSAEKKPVEITPTPVQHVRRVQPVLQPSFFRSNMKLLAIVGIVIVLLAVIIPTAILLSGNDKGKFVGTWIGGPPNETPATVTFFDDGRITILPQGFDTVYGSYEVKDGKLYMTSKGSTVIFTYSFLNNDRTFIATSIQDPSLIATFNKLS